MEVFGEIPGFVYLEDIEFNTLINEMDDGAEKRRNKWPVGTINGVTQGCAKRTFRLVYKGIDQTRYSTILQFFSQRIGKKEAFYWENFNESPITYNYPNKIILTSNYQGENTINLAHYPIIPNSQIIYDDDVALVEGVDYSFTDATGLITWLIEPANASVLKASYRFYREVRFDHDKISPERIAYQKYNFDLIVKEIKPRL